MIMTFENLIDLQKFKIEKADQTIYEYLMDSENPFTLREQTI